MTRLSALGLFGLLVLASSSVVACADETGATNSPVDPASAQAGHDPAAAAPTGPAASGDPAASEMPTYLKTPASSTFMTGVEMGTPFDSIVDVPTIGAASAIAPGFAIEEVPGQLQAKATIRRIETTEDLYSALEVSASLEVQGKLWGASVSTSFAKERKLHSEYLYVLVDASALGRTQRIAKPALTDEAKKLGPSAFYERFGDRYASTIVMGQQVFGLIEIRTRSLEEKERLAVSLGVSYGPSSFNASFKSTLETSTTNIEKHVWAGALGTTMPITDDIDAFITKVDEKFTEFTSSKADPGTQTLFFRYSSYYGIDGYPGVPADVEPKVAEHAQAASDYLVYTSLLGDYTRRGYDVADPILAGMKTYSGALEGYLTKSLETSPALPARPAIDPKSKLESFAKIDAKSLPGQSFAVHAYENGFVPKKLADYEIPLRYTRDGKRNGVDFSPITVNQPINAYAQPAPSGLHLWTVRRDTPTGTALALAYRWGDGASYFIENVTSNGAISLPAVATELDRDDYVDLTGAGTAYKRFVLVNEASGLVITRTTADNNNLFQKRLRTPTVVANSYPYQAWGTSSTWAQWTGDQWAVNLLNNQKQPSQRWLIGPDNGPWNVGWNSGAPDVAIHQWGLDADNAQYFTFTNAGGGFRFIVTQTGGGVVSVRPTCNVSPCEKPWLADGQDIVQLPMTNGAGAHQRWRLVALEHIEEIR